MKDTYNILLELYEELEELNSSYDSRKLLSCFYTYKSMVSDVAKSSSYYASSLQGIQTELIDIKGDLDIAKSLNSEKQIRHYNIALHHLIDDLKVFIDTVRIHKGYEKNAN